MFGSQDKAAHINKLRSSPVPGRTWEGQHSDPSALKGPVFTPQSFSFFPEMSPLASDSRLHLQALPSLKSDIDYSEMSIV